MVSLAVYHLALRVSPWNQFRVHDYRWLLLSGQFVFLHWQWEVRLRWADAMRMIGVPQLTGSIQAAVNPKSLRK